MANIVEITVRGKDEFGKTSTGLKGHLGGIKSSIKSMAAAGAAFGALQIFKNSIKGASDLNESISKTNVVFGKNAGEIHKWAQSAATSMGISRNSAEEFAGSLGLIFTQMGSTTREASKMSRSWIKLASDIASFNNADPTEILNAMQSATRGEFDELQRYVPSVSAAAIQHEALAISGKESADALSQHDKLLALQKILFRDTAKAQGDFARTSSGAANQQRILNAQWEDAQAKLGKGLLPILTQAARALSKLLDFGSRNSQWIGPVTAGLVSMAAALKSVAIAQGLANVAAEANPYVRIATVILALGAALVVAYKKSEIFRNIMIDTAATTAQAFIRLGETIVNTLLSAFNLIVQGAAKGFGWLPVVGKRIKESAKEIQAWKDSVVGSFDKASDSVENWSTNLKNAPKVAKLKGDIHDLESKLYRARSQLNDRNLTKERRAQINANISQLESKLRKARAALNKLNGATATAFVNVAVRAPQKIPYFGSGHFAHGGLVGAQTGGPRSNRVLVGENGPEIADLPAGTMVHSNPDSRRMMSQGVNGGHLVLEFAGGSGSDLERILWEWIKKNVRIRGGKSSNSVQKALGY